ncbi:hypothetical protein [Mesorhizobium sp. 1B3]|uniref:hypothetical protein n=1 Tax=Mesorhizobium sp. 1B3 TaxID=3243599 RepID=UPI003D96EF9D
MSKIVMSVLVILASVGTSSAQNAPYPGTLASDLRLASQSDRNDRGVVAKRVKAFSLARQPVMIPNGYGLSLGRIKPIIDVRNDRLHYGR